MDFHQQMAQYQSSIDRALHACFSDEQKIPQPLLDAMQYSLFAGGKRLRPVLLLASASLLGVAKETAMPYACAVEMIHTYSLIHDDLPAMDNDDMRRGKPTCHKMYGEGMAILAGDGLLHHAFQVMLDDITSSKNLLWEKAQAAQILAHGSGNFGMVAGQCMDIVSEGKPITPQDMRFIHEHKTGELIKASLLAGIALGNPTQVQLDAMGLFGQHIGLAFQITDDILDITGNAQKLGKNIHSDEKKDKCTYPQLFGLEKAKIMAQKEVLQAVEALNGFDGQTRFLTELARHIISRNQ